MFCQKHSETLHVYALSLKHVTEQIKLQLEIISSGYLEPPSKAKVKDCMNNKTVQGNS